MEQRFNTNLLLVGILGLALVVVGLLVGGDFFTSRNITSMGFQLAEFGFLALAMALAMLSGGIDLSIIGNMNLSGILAGLLLTNRTLTEALGGSGSVAAAVLIALGTSLLGVWLICAAAVLIALVASAAFGLINGILIAVAEVPAILATIGTMMLYSGIAMAITGGQGVVGFPNEFRFIGNGTLVGLPFPMLLMIAAFAVLAIFLRGSVWGRSIYLYGENKVASLFSGVRNTRTLIVTYTISGLLCGISGLILMSRSNSIRVGYGNTYLLQAILVSILGGIDPDGGSGRVTGVFIGILILQSLSSAFTLLRISPYARGLIYGVMLLVVMIIDASVNSGGALARLTAAIRGARGKKTS